MIAITLRNDFHGTTAQVAVSTGGRAKILSAATVARVRRALCGVAGCSCSGDLGVRGHQSTDDGFGVEINDLSTSRGVEYMVRVLPR